MAHLFGDQACSSNVLLHGLRNWCIFPFLTHLILLLSPPFCILALLDDNEGRKVTSKRQSGPGSQIVTKHDAIICGRRNARNVENVSAM